jgi:hypothetical protein
MRFRPRRGMQGINHVGGHRFAENLLVHQAQTAAQLFLALPE